jgi:UDP-N-acetyl-2-amino-2-deoxyglucuronate dehydrogenase
LAAVDRIIALEKASGRKIAVVSQHRFDRATETVEAAIAAGELGRQTSGIASCAWLRDVVDPRGEIDRPVDHDV